MPAESSQAPLGPHEGPRGRVRYLLAYAGMLAGAVATFALVRAVGEHGIRDEGLAASPRGSGAPDTVLRVLLALAVVMLVARALGALVRRLGQPPVIGEVIAGLLLGPSFLGHVAPSMKAFVFPATIVPAMTVIAQIGVILYMFIVGVHLDTQRLKGRTHIFLAVSHASIAVPFSLGAILALALYPALAPPGVGFTVFALFIAVSMSVTAFPVLARILTDSGLAGSRLGTIALACASVDDVTAWCLLAFVVAVVESQGTSMVTTLVLTVTYVGVMYAVVRPAAAWLARWRERRTELPAGLLSICLAALLVSATVTEAIGIHALLGAFLLGMVVPHDSALARDLTERLESVVVVLLLPAYFALTGMRTDIGLLTSGRDWLICLAIIAVASLGKFGGSTVAARLAGLGWRDAAALGILMNTRGLMELIVLNVGLDLGVLSSRLFTMLVIMAVVTTLATAPLLRTLRLEQEA